jgi:hypothetical protein
VVRGLGSPGSGMSLACTFAFTPPPPPPGLLFPGTPASEPDSLMPTSAPGLDSALFSTAPGLTGLTPCPPLRWDGTHQYSPTAAPGRAICCRWARPGPSSSPQPGILNASCIVTGTGPVQVRVCIEGWAHPAVPQLHRWRRTGVAAACSAHWERRRRRRVAQYTSASLRVSAASASLAADSFQRCTIRRPVSFGFGTASAPPHARTPNRSVRTWYAGSYPRRECHWSTLGGTW